MIGIVSYGVYIPLYRLKTADVAGVWGKDPRTVYKSLEVTEKSITSFDEDTVTMSFEASWRAIKSARISPEKLGAVFVGSESHPYAVNPTATIIAEFLGVGKNYIAVDTQFACKAATTNIIAQIALVAQKRINYGLSVGADCAQAKPHDVLEYSAGSGAAALIISRGGDVAVSIEESVSYNSDTPDFWRRDGVSYPSHGGRFTGEPGYFAHVLGAAEKLLKKTGMKPSNFSHCVFHMPNGRFPVIAAKRLGFSYNQLKHSLIVERIGNPYSASALIGLANVLDQAKPNQYIFFVSYGSGAGSDAFLLKTTKALSSLQKRQCSVRAKIKKKRTISYIDYLKMRSVI